MADWSYHVSKVSLGLAALNVSAIPPSAFTVASSGQALEIKQPVVDQRFVDQAVALSEARTEARISDLKGDMRVVTEGLANLKSRFDELAGKMASVPADIAAMRRDVALLPSKEDLSTKLRNWLAVAVAVVGAMIAFATFIIKTLPGAAT